MGRAERVDSHELHMWRYLIMFGMTGIRIRHLACRQHFRSHCNISATQQARFFLPCVLHQRLKNASIYLTIASAAWRLELARLIGNGRQTLETSKDPKLRQLSAAVSLSSFPHVKNTDSNKNFSSRLTLGQQSRQLELAQILF